MKTGSNWLRGCRITKLSPLGEQVADLLGDLFVGLYHLDGAEKVDWANDHHIEVRVAYKEWGSFDSNLLTKLVFLAHDRCLRVSISPRSAHALTLLFHQRQRDGGTWQRHPTIDQALAMHREYYPIETPASDPPLLADEIPGWLLAETERHAALGDATPPDGWGAEGWPV